jgi:anti-sigma regulatory factor (Ser/Thr protein kinase)
MALELRRDLADLQILVERLEQFAERHGLADTMLSSMTLALEEAVTNVIHYGFDDDDGAMIRIEITCDAGGLTAVIEDNGRAFDPLQATAPDVTAPLEEREVGGLGIMLIRKLMDEVRYARHGSRNVLMLRKQR